MSDDFVCDFCGGLNPVWMYAHPQMYSDLFDIDFKAGHMSACETCGLLHEGDDIALLVNHVMASKPNEVPLDFITDRLTRLELAGIYARVAKERQTFKP